MVKLIRFEEHSAVIKIRRRKTEMHQLHNEHNTLQHLTQQPFGFITWLSKHVLPKQYGHTPTDKRNRK